jgi:hypothetical protein
LLKDFFNNFAKTNPKFIKFVEFIEKQIPKKKIQNVEFISDGKVLLSTNTTELFNNDINVKSLPFLLLNIDFLIYTETKNNEQERTITYKKIIEPEQYESCDKTIFNCEPTNYTFLLTEIIIGEDKIMANLKNDDCNFFVKDNKFSKKFIKYYLNNFNLEKIEDYTIQFLDQDVKEVKIKNNMSILLDKNNYMVVEDLFSDSDLVKETSVK